MNKHSNNNNSNYLHQIVEMPDLNQCNYSKLTPNNCILCNFSCNCLQQPQNSPQLNNRRLTFLHNLHRSSVNLLPGVILLLPSLPTDDFVAMLGKRIPLTDRLRNATKWPANGQAGGRYFSSVVCQTTRMLASVVSALTIVCTAMFHLDKKSRQTSIMNKPERLADHKDLN